MPATPLMDPDQPNTYQRTSRSGLVLFGLLGLAACVVAIAWLAGRPRPIELKLHAQTPTILARGWVNGEAPTQTSLDGKVVLIEVLATWCAPCRAMMPNMVKLHEQFAPRGVVFIGLTTDEEDAVAAMKRLLRHEGVRWPTGWGADQTIRELGADHIPAVFVVGSGGHIVWAKGDGSELPRVLEAALKQSTPRS